MDYFILVRIFEESANAGNVKSMIELGNLYSRDWAFKYRNISKAISWYEMAANKGSSEAMVSLGEIYAGFSRYNDYEKFFNISKHKDYILASYWWHVAAKKGNPNAFANLGWMYNDKNFGNPNSRKSLHWYEKEARFWLSKKKNQKDLQRINFGEKASYLARSYKLLRENEHDYNKARFWRKKSEEFDKQSQSLNGIR